MFKNKLLPLIIVLIALFSASIFAKSRASLSLQNKIFKDELISSTDIKLPSYNITTFDGKTLNLKKIKSKLILLNFWATWCVPCRIELKEFNQLQKEIDPANLTIIAVSIDEDLKFAKSYFKNNPQSYSLVFDFDNQLKHHFKIENLPSTFIINEDKKILGKVSGLRQWSNENWLKYYKSL